MKNSESQFQIMKVNVDRVKKIPPSVEVEGMVFACFPGRKLLRPTKCTLLLRFISVLRSNGLRKKDD